MPVRITVDQNRIARRVSHPLNEQGMEMLCSQILRNCNEYCKEDTGMLIASSMIHSDLKHGVLIWQTPYAARQYYEIRTAYTDVNPMATWRWVESAKTNYATQWGRQAQALLRLYGT